MPSFSELETSCTTTVLLDNSCPLEKEGAKNKIVALMPPAPRVSNFDKEGSSSVCWLVA